MLCAHTGLRQMRAEQLVPFEHSRELALSFEF
jgi:hypothetical protein